LTIKTKLVPKKLRSRHNRAKRGRVQGTIIIITIKPGTDKL
jgi:hypothetical protein